MTHKPILNCHFSINDLLPRTDYKLEQSLLLLFLLLCLLFRSFRLFGLDKSAKNIA